MQKLTLVRKQSRIRRQFISTLKDKYQAYLEDREEILKEHANKDDEGNPIIKNDHYDVKNQTALLEDITELNKEVVVIEGGDNREMIRTMKPILRKFEDEEYGGEESEIYDYLCDQFKLDEGEDGHESDNNGN
ncbi:DUF1617 family protein [Amphibacillus sp. MSJ-3]|nr:DUF1617 family protein [Amphibacillus sp. MSJ-3]